MHDVPREPLEVCKRGHEMTPNNINRPEDGRRRCRTCAQLRALRTEARSRVERAKQILAQALTDLYEAEEAMRIEEAS